MKKINKEKMIVIKAFKNQQTLVTKNLLLQMYEYMYIVIKKLVYKPHNNNLCPESFLKIFQICLPYRKYFTLSLIPIFIQPLY